MFKIPYKSIVFLLLLFSAVNVFSQTIPPKREFRAAWVATVSNLDWPLTKNNVSAQKSELITLLDSLKSAGINVIMFQVRPAADAFYISSLEPWSYWLTGTQGLAPSPLYDPLSYAIEEAHKRGMELHAWFNPYRAINGTYTLASNHIMKTRPQWILTMKSDTTKKIMNPGLDSVRYWILNVISDVVRRYDIDGVHMDDYFYPYPPANITTEDTATFSAYPRGFSNIGDWRRNNVNILISAINDSVRNIKPWVKFGMSPFGIWRPGYPTGITGMDAYSTIYCDAMNWLRNKAVDYLTPQLYWKIGGSQDYSKLMPWWADSVFKFGRHFYPGQALTSSGYTNAEVPMQVDLNRANPKVQGNVIFRAASIRLNTLNYKDSLQNNFHRYPSLHPVMTWKDSIIPNPPRDFLALGQSNSIQLTWNKPVTASDGDMAKKFVIYRSLSSPVDINDARNIIYISVNDTTKFTDTKVTTGTRYYYHVTALDEGNNESNVSGLASAVPGTSLNVLADFETGVNTFDRTVTYSGSTRGISKLSSQGRVTNESFNSTGSLRIILKDSVGSNDDWRARILSGTGSPANNIALPSTGNIGFWIKTSTASTGARVGITVDDSSGTEHSPLMYIINDGLWHYYSFDFGMPGWTSFSNGNGKVNGTTVTLDAIMLYAPNNSPDWTLYVDDVTYSPATFPVLNLMVNIEGLYDHNTDRQLTDSIWVFLRSSSYPHQVVDSFYNVLDSTGIGLFYFRNAVIGNSYYYVVKHRNSLETWSANPVNFGGSLVFYNFTALSSQAYGNNMIKKGSKWCLISGDVNQDGQINLDDLILIDTDNQNFNTGYLNTDVNGDGQIDLSDLLITDINNQNFVSVKSPLNAK